MAEENGGRRRSGGALGAEKRILVIVPAYNEEASVGAVVKTLRAVKPSVDVLVVDDGSQDRTARVARAQGATVVSLPFNLGIGGAVQTGYVYAREKGYDVAIQVDADGQHDAAEIPKLLEVVLSGRADLVTGSRFLEDSGSYRVGAARRAGIRYFARLLRVLLRNGVTDPTSGFRAASRQAILLFSDDYPTDYPEVEAIVLLHKNGLRTSEVPVRMSARARGESSIGGLDALYYMVKVSLAIFVQMLRPRRRKR